MRRLTRVALRRLRPAGLAQERGAVAVVVALLMVPLLGCAALAVDVAAVYSDRAQLHNAADAAALSVATDCATGTCGNTTATATTAVAANITANITVATPAVSVSGQRVTVTVTAQQTHWFAPVLGIDSSTVTATATATWQGTSAAVAQIPMAISWCEYKSQIAQYPLTSTTPHLLGWSTGWLSLCVGPTGSVILGGHARTDTDSSSVCGSTSAVGDEVGISLFTSKLPSSCTSAYLNGLVGTNLQVPVWGDINGSLFTGYRAVVYGYALFHLTGYTLTSDAPLFYGYFTRGVSQTSATTGSTSTTAPYLGSGSISLGNQG